VEWDELPKLFPELPEPGRWLALLRRHAALVEQAAPRVRVSAVPAAEAIRRQYAESLELWRIVSRHNRPSTLVDVGSGGGFPGLVIACAAPEVAVTLVEPLQKRAALLGDMAAALDLTNVTVAPLRAEDAGRGPLRDGAQCVTARAVAEVRELLEYTAPLAAAGGTIALPKGSRLSEELAEAGHALRELACELVGVEPMRPQVSETVSVVLLRKVADTPERYPRRPGIPGKRPL
jgi:16S rRNA (guanine527-N7)-methyltransferase